MGLSDVVRLPRRFLNRSSLKPVEGRADRWNRLAELTHDPMIEKVSDDINDKVKLVQTRRLFFTCNKKLSSYSNQPQRDHLRQSYMK
jgi:hypothetical protein